MDLGSLPLPPRLPRSLSVDPALTGLSDFRLPSAPREVQQGGIKEAAESFASYLYAQVFSHMRPEDSGEEGGLFSGETSGMFMDFLDQELGKQFVGSGGGSALAEQLQRQLTGQPIQPPPVKR